MLFLLSAPQQTGKTRWLEGLVAEAADGGVPVWGVVAPGVWRAQGDGGLEKLGIDNVLLPEGTRVPFARRRDLARAEGAYDERSQSARAGLLWEISDAAIAEVNAHFRRLAARAGEPAEGRRALLVVDELGALELLRRCGLTDAVESVERGPSPAVGNALVVVRPDLAPLAEERFFGIWGNTETIAPDEAGRRAVMDAVAGR